MPRSRVLSSILALLAFCVFGALGAGCSRSTLESELGAPGQLSCATTPCPAGTTCDPATLLCSANDGGGPEAGPCNANTQFDPFNCGACGIVCPSGDSCVDGACTRPNESCATTGCAFGQSCCAQGCIDTGSDPNNCGSCGLLCPSESACVNGSCTITPPPPGCTLTGCSPGLACCADTCVPSGSDPNNCGGCGLACPSSAPLCIQGSCCAKTVNGLVCATPVCNCAAGQTCCGTSGCLDTTSDPENCGGCGNACPNGGSCVGSVCASTCAGGSACSGAASCCKTGCSNVTSDPLNCGSCGIRCSAGQACVLGACVSECGAGGTCGVGQTCCNGACASTNADPANCGGCNIQCGPTASCVDGSCVADEGAFNPIVNPTYLAPGVHTYTTIDVPAGVTVYVAGGGALSGTLDLHATGAITIDGTIDVSGGPGGQNTITSQSTQSGRAGGGGFTGEPYATAALSAACQFVAGNPGSLGLAVSGATGSCTVGSTTICDTINSTTSEVFTSPPAAYGGGGGVFTGYRAYGAGGGGAAGGAPGSAGTAYPGEPDCGGVTGGGGATAGSGGQGGVAGGTYDGAQGILGQTQCPGTAGAPAAYVGGGGGGSIGIAAASDLAVQATFQTGSGGGGGSADYLNRPVFGGTSGGGGGGGALRLSTPATISVTGQLLANGGAGGDSVIGTSLPNCDPQPGAAGGGGSGGVIYLSAPSITVSPTAIVSAEGGAGGAQSEFASGGGGGAGGLGRIRISVTASTCSLGGAISPPPLAGCAAKGGAPGFAYVGSYPN